MEKALAIEIEGLRKLKTRALQARYYEVFGEETRSSNQAHLLRRLAWRLQAEAEGGLSARAQKRAAELAEEAALRLRAPRRTAFSTRSEHSPLARRPILSFSTRATSTLGR